MQCDVDGAVALGGLVVADVHVPLAILLVQVVGALLLDLQIRKIAP